MANVKVVQKPDEEVPTEVLADAIVEISKGIKALRASRLKDKTLYFLISKSSGQPAYVIERVLDAIESLAKTYLK